MITPVVSEQEESGAQMNKEELVEHLRKKGYDAVLEDGAVYVLVDKPMDKKERKKLGSEIEKADYRSSWGWRRK